MKKMNTEIDLMSQISKGIDRLNTLNDTNDRYYAVGYLHGTFTSFMRGESKASQKRFLKHVNALVKLNADKRHQEGK